MKRLIIHPAAAAELEEAAAYLETQVEGLGRDLRAEIEKALKRLMASPKACPPYGGGTGLRKCFISRFHYAIVFLEGEEAIYVFAVAHGSRRQGYWRGRIGGSE